MVALRNEYNSYQPNIQEIRYQPAENNIEPFNIEDERRKRRVQQAIESYDIQPKESKIVISIEGIGDITESDLENIELVMRIMESEEISFEEKELLDFLIAKKQFETIEKQIMQDKALLPEIKTNSNKSKPYAFDVKGENDNKVAYGEEYWEIFKKNMETYAGEMILKVDEAEFELNIVRNPEGQASIMYGKKLEYNAVESSLKATQLEDKPLWWKARTYRDAMAMRQAEKLITAGEIQPGEKLISMSSAPWYVPENKRKEQQFSTHSFVWIYELGQDDEGNEQLYAKALRTYNNEEKLRELYETTTGESSEEKLTLVGEVKKLDKRFNTSSVKHMLKILYQETPKEEKIPMPLDYANVLSDEEIEDIMSQTESEVREIFDMLGPHANRKTVLERFNQWQNKVKNLKNGTTLDENHKGENQERKENYTSSGSGSGGGGEDAGDCGVGFGWSESGNGSESMDGDDGSGLATYENATKKTKKKIKQAEEIIYNKKGICRYRINGKIYYGCQSQGKEIYNLGQCLVCKACTEYDTRKNAE